jgi:hypothetical protein
MNYQDVDSENGVRIFGLGSWSSDDATTMTDDDGDGIYSTTVNLASGDYEFKFRNGWDYEDVDELGCAVLTSDYWNRGLSVLDSDVILDISCFGACADCIPGCMDPNADNYDPDANTSSIEHECTYPQVEPDNIFFSEYGEGSSNHKFLEIYNGTGQVVDLSGYAFPNATNGANTAGEYDYWNEFDSGAAINPGDVYVICHSSSDNQIQSECDQNHTYLSNGDDGFCLVEGNESSFEVLDCIGTWDAEDPGNGWDVAGVSDATKDHTLIRKENIQIGNNGNYLHLFLQKIPNYHYYLFVYFLF